MSASPTPLFEIANEMRTLAERNVEQAKLAFNNCMQAAQAAVSAFDRWIKASQVGALGIQQEGDELCPA